MVIENLYTPGCIRTYTGKYINPLTINPDQVDIVDIAWSLSNQCRFGGHTKEYLSVAQHSIMVSKRFEEKRKALAGILHDGSECYLVDLPKPIKDQLPDYAKMEERVMWAIRKRFGIRQKEFDAVKDADKSALEFEWENIVIANTGLIECWTPKKAYEEFLKEFNYITKVMGLLS